MVEAARARSWMAAPPEQHLARLWCQTHPFSSFYRPQLASRNEKMMRQLLSLLCEPKRPLKITIWGKVALRLHLLCTERGAREGVSENLQRYGQIRKNRDLHGDGEGR